MCWVNGVAVTQATKLNQGIVIILLDKSTLCVNSIQKQRATSVNVFSQKELEGEDTQLSLMAVNCSTCYS